jgi:hypothetical protein
MPEHGALARFEPDPGIPADPNGTNAVRTHHKGTSAATKQA